MEMQTDFSLKHYNTFGIDARAGHYARFSTTEELMELLEVKPFDGKDTILLGGGSNILFTKDPSAVLKNEVTGIEKTAEDADHVYVRAGAGENWHGLVTYCIDHDWAGIENLSLIPGSAGAGPMQNIGAYGVEIKDVFHSLEAFHLGDKAMVTFSNADCAFGYRESVFKNKYKGQFVIVNVTLRLNKIPSYNISYGAIEKELEAMGATQPDIHLISRAVINIRSSKLPDPQKIGNAGSFFKNPEVSAEEYARLEKDFPGLVAYPVNRGFKLAAGWLIEQCGWKGYRDGDAGVHAKQALVLVNYGNASGQDIYRLSEKILQSVQEKFGISLQREVNIV
ncbi:MAG TPA: UDP-N-acetylmuramate dehydrogenase [Chitinophagaceae bacterium]|nr:UDP-N-acetylmuramate dehydrogenase [Chitinophagaceae bacterium]